MKTQNPDTFINKFYFIVILVCMTIFFFSNLRNNENTITETQKEQFNTNQDYIISER